MTEQKKVTLTSKEALILNHLNDVDMSVFEVAERYVNDDLIAIGLDVTVHFDFSKLMSALINGYEVERTPEERLLEHYDLQLDFKYEALEAFDGEYGGVSVGEYEAHINGIYRTLDILGIKIEGINC